MEETKIFDGSDIKYALIEKTVNEVIEILEERGYNPYNQIVGYLMSGDPGYISSHKEARTKISAFERSEVLEYLVKKSSNALSRH